MIRHGTAIPIGSGATSRVYKCWNEVRGEWVAIKYLNQSDPVALARLLREARAVGGLRHPHLCPLLEVGESDGRHYVMMPFLDGVTFGEALPGLSIEARLRLLAQIADAVHYAHECGLLHRDLKPDNVLVTDADGLPHAWVLDFGLVREVGGPNLTETGQVLGTPAYMSPEQARGETTLDRRSDVFALGSLMYFAIAGTPPFAAASTAETLARVIQGDPPRLRQFRRNTPVALEAIVSTALQKSPARRYDSAREFADDVRRYLAGDAPHARLELGDSLRRSARRHPLLVGIGLALALAAAIAGAVAMRMEARMLDSARMAAEIAAAAEAARQSLNIEFLRPRHDIERVLGSTLILIDRLSSADPGDPRLLQRNLRAAAELRIALDDLEGALPLLRRAQAGNPDDHAVGRVLGLTLARAYRAAMAAPRPFADPVLRERWRKDANATYLEPARDILRSAAVMGSDALADAEIAFADGAFDTAFAILAGPEIADSSGYEALLAAAEMHMTLGIQHQWTNAGDNASAAFERAQTLLQRAIDFGRSDPRLHRRHCELAALRVTALAEGNYSAEELVDAESPCHAALEVRPGDPILHATLAHLLATRAKQQRAQGVDVEALLDSALASAERGHQLAPDDARIAQELALVLMRKSTHLRWSGRTVAAPIERALAVLRVQVAMSDRSVDPLVIAGQVQVEHAQVLERLGEDPVAAYERAIESMRTAVSRVPEAAFLRLNLASALSALAYVRATRGRPDVPLVEESIGELHKVIEAQPGRASAWLSLANGHWDLAMAGSWRGDASAAAAAIAEAERLFTRAAQLAPDNLSIAFNEYSFVLFVAAEDIREGRSPASRLERAAVLARKIDAQTRTDWITPCPRAEYELRRSQVSARTGTFDRQARSRTLKLIEDGLATQPGDVDCARRRIELAAISLPFLSASERERERSAAAAMRLRHSGVLEVDLAWAHVLASGASPGDRDELVPLVDRLDRETSGFWSARLAPLRAAVDRRQVH